MEEDWNQLERSAIFGMWQSSIGWQIVPSPKLTGLRRQTASVTRRKESTARAEFAVPGRLRRLRRAASQPASFPTQHTTTLLSSLPTHRIGDLEHGMGLLIATTSKHRVRHGSTTATGTSNICMRLAMHQSTVPSSTERNMLCSIDRSIDRTPS